MSRHQLMAPTDDEDSPDPLRIMDVFPPLQARQRAVGSGLAKSFVCASSSSAAPSSDALDPDDLVKIGRGSRAGSSDPDRPVRSSAAVGGSDALTETATASLASSAPLQSPSSNSHPTLFDEPASSTPTARVLTQSTTTFQRAPTPSSPCSSISGRTTHVSTPKRKREAIMRAVDPSPDPLAVEYDPPSSSPLSETSTVHPSPVRRPPSSSPLSSLPPTPSTASITASMVPSPSLGSVPAMRKGKVNRRVPDEDVAVPIIKRRKVVKSVVKEKAPLEKKKKDAKGKTSKEPKGKGKAVEREESPALTHKTPSPSPVKKPVARRVLGAASSLSSLSYFPSSHSLSSQFLPTPSASASVSITGREETLEETSSKWNLNSMDTMVWVWISTVPTPEPATPELDLELAEQERKKGFWWPAKFLDPLRTARPLRLAVLLPSLISKFTIATVELLEPSVRNIRSFRTTISGTARIVRFDTSNFVTPSADTGSGPASSAMDKVLAESLRVESEQDDAELDGADLDDDKGSGSSELDEEEEGAEKIPSVSDDELDRAGDLCETIELDSIVIARDSPKSAVYWPAKIISLAATPSHPVGPNGRPIVSLPQTRQFTIEWGAGGTGQVPYAWILTSLQKAFYRVEIGALQTTYDADYADRFLTLLEDAKLYLGQIMRDEYLPAREWNDTFYKGGAAQKQELTKWSRTGQVEARGLSIIRCGLQDWVAGSATTPKPVGSAAYEALNPLVLTDYIASVLLPLAVVQITILENDLRVAASTLLASSTPPLLPPGMDFAPDVEKIEHVASVLANEFFDKPKDINQTIANLRTAKKISQIAVGNGDEGKSYRNDGKLKRSGKVVDMAERDESGEGRKKKKGKGKGKGKGGKQKG